MGTNRNLELVQLLRGVAALLVVLYHASEGIKQNFTTNFLFDFFNFGSAGVDIFFVLSGFIITYTSARYLGHQEKLVDFLRRRFVRIFPTYWLITVVFLLLQIALPAFYTTKFPLEGPEIVRTFLVLPAHRSLNGVSWTLTYELFFYFLFATAFIVPNRHILTGLALTYCTAIVIGGVFFQRFSWNQWLGLVFYPMNLEFFLGMLSTLLIPRLSAKAGVGFIVAGTLAFLGSAIFSNMGGVLIASEFNRVILFGIPSFFILSGVVAFELQRHRRINPLLLKLGNGSYSLYLIHLPVLVALCKIMVLLSIHNTYLLHLLMLAAIVVVCWLSILFYYWIEKPIIERLNNWRGVRVANEI